MIIISESIFQYKGRKTFHLSSTESLDELFEFANKIGLRHEWFQDKRFPHFDIFGNKIDIARVSGAKEISSKEFIETAINKGRIQ